MIELSTLQIHFSKEEAAAATVKDYTVEVNDTQSTLTIRAIGNYEISDNGQLFVKELTLQANRFKRIRANIRVRVHPNSADAEIQHMIGQNASLLQVTVGGAAPNPVNDSPNKNIIRQSLSFGYVAAGQSQVRSLSQASDVKKWALQTPSEAFGVSDDSQLLFDDDAKGSTPNFVRFQPKSQSAFKALLIGYNAQHKPVTEVLITGTSKKPLPLGWIGGGVAAAVLLGLLVYFLFFKTNGQTDERQIGDLNPTNRDTLIVGFSEQLLLKDQEGIQRDLLRAIPHAVVDVYTYENEPIARLYALQRQKKVHFVVALPSEADTNALLWSVPYTAEDGKIGVLRTEHNRQWIQQINQAINNPNITTQQP